MRQVEMIAQKFFAGAIFFVVLRRGVFVFVFMAICFYDVKVIVSILISKSFFNSFNE
jgi:hypothetical protein